MGSPAPQGFSECHSTFRAACPVLVWPRLWVGSASGPCALASWCPCVVAFSFFFLGGCARGLGFPCCPVPWPCLPAGYFMACSMWWLKRSPSFSLIVCSIVSRALPSIICGTDRVRTASIGERPDPFLWNGNIRAPSSSFLEGARNVPCFNAVRCPFIIVTLMVYGFGARTIANGPASPLKLTVWPGIFRSLLFCRPFGTFGDILKCTGVNVLPSYSRVAPSTVMPETFIFVFPFLGFLAASLMAAVSTP